MRQFRLLNPDEIECRVARVTDKSVQLLLYKTARTDFALLDDTVGWMNWQCEYRSIDGKMYCGIGIKDKETGEWIWKWNAGTESNMEAVKGEASDSLKRAGYCWGIGTELYSSPQIYVPIENCNIKNGKCYDDFIVTAITYDKAENINGLVISVKGEVVYDMKQKMQKKSLSALVDEKRAEKAAAKEDEDLPFIFKDEPGGEPAVFSGKPTCYACRKEIDSRVADYSKQYYGKYLCRDCQPKFKKIK